MLSNNESTLGKSATQPHKILANVFVMPIIDNRNDAELWSTPYIIINIFRVLKRM